MLVFRTLFSLAAAALAVANPLSPRQTANTNSAIHDIVNALDTSVHVAMPDILMLQATHTANARTIGTQVSSLITAFTKAKTSLAKTPISIGSTTVAPTNDDISITFSDVMQIVSTGLSGLTTATIPTLASILGPLDPAIASTVTQFNTTLPGSVNLVHIMMLDAQQFFVTEGTFPQTLAALGF